MKKTLYTLALWGCLHLSIANSPHSSTDSTEGQRFFFAVASFDGGDAKARLRYSKSDAERFGQVLRELGGTDLNREKLLVEPTPTEFKLGLNQLADQMKSQKYKARQEVIVYYSGHADEKGLILRGGNLPWKELRQAIQALPADIRLSVIDACGSGAIIRSKGGIKRQAFLRDKNDNLKGSAFLTSSSESEVSQESDRIKASFFTHAFTSGLRGAADFNGDRKISLSEAYQYAYQQTLQSTNIGEAGTQHPLRDMDLSGSGDLILTDLNQSHSALTLDASLSGLFWIYDTKGQMIAGVQKNPGRILQLGMDTGYYQIKTENLSRQLQFSLQLDKNQDILLDSLKMIELSQSNQNIVITRSTIDNNAVLSTTPLPQKALNTWEKCDSMVLATKNFPKKNQWDLLHHQMIESSHGLQSSLFLTESEVFGSGVQLGVFGSSQANKGWSGLQASYFYNRTKTCMNGVQISTILNVSDKQRGVQLALINIADSIQGVQGGLINYTTRSIAGVQGGLINIGGIKEGSMDSAQTIRVQGGLLNLNRGQAHVQGGLLNLSQNTKVQGGLLNLFQNNDVQGGLINIQQQGQFQGGLLNLSKENNVQIGNLNLALKTSYQFGLLNGVKLGHLQIGLVNFSDSVDFALGLLTISRTGILEITAQIDETGQKFYGLRTGTPYFYTHYRFSDFRNPFKGLDVDYTPTKEQDWGVVPSVGIGTRFGIRQFWWPELEYQYTFYLPTTKNADHTMSYEDFKNKTEYNDQHRLNLNLGWNPVKMVGISTGLSANLLYTHGNQPVIHPIGKYEYSPEGSNYRIWPGFHAELRIGFTGINQW